MNLEQSAIEAGLGDFWRADEVKLNRFAALIVESCAKVCDEPIVSMGTREQTNLLNAGRMDCANAIRAMIKEGE